MSTEALKTEVLRAARLIEQLKRDCGTDPESPQAIRNAQYMGIAAILRAALAAAPAGGAEPVAYLLLDQGCRAPDDCEDFERVVLPSEIPPEELKRFQNAGRCSPLYAAPTAQPQPVAPMDEDDLQEFCISLSFEQDDYTTEVIRAVEDRMRGVPLFVPASAPTVQPQPGYSDSTSGLHIGDSAFEDWYQSYCVNIPANPKQAARDAYAAGMGDPLVMARAPAAQPTLLNGLTGQETAASDSVAGLSGAQPEPDDLITVAHVECEGGAGTLTVDFDQMGTLGVLLGEEEETYTVRIAPMTRADFEALGEFDGF